MHTLPAVSIIFLTISVIFLIVSLRDYLQSKGAKAIARRIWLRMAFIFAAVGIGLYFLNHFSQ